MVSLVDIETTSKPCATRNSRSGSQPRSPRTPYPRFSDARVGYRFYDNKVGRWITQDPLGVKAGLNVYSYCDDDPINFVDPWGLYTRQQLIQAQRVAIDGGVLRMNELDALRNGDFDTFRRLEQAAEADVYGRNGEQIGRNPVIDAWEKGKESKCMDRKKWRDKFLAIISGGGSAAIDQVNTEWELLRQLAMLRYVQDKAAEQGVDISHYTMNDYLGL